MSSSFEIFTSKRDNHFILNLFWNNVIMLMRNLSCMKKLTYWLFCHRNKLFWYLSLWKFFFHLIEDLIYASLFNSGLHVNCQYNLIFERKSYYIIKNSWKKICNFTLNLVSLAMQWCRYVQTPSSNMWYVVPNQSIYQSSSTLTAATAYDCLSA